jgi:hypothetical protein
MTRFISKILLITFIWTTVLQAYPHADVLTNPVGIEEPCQKSVSSFTKESVIETLLVESGVSDEVLAYVASEADLTLSAKMGAAGSALIELANKDFNIKNGKDVVDLTAATLLGGVPG